MKKNAFNLLFLVYFSWEWLNRFFSTQGMQRWQKNLCGWSSCALWGHVELVSVCGNNHNDKPAPCALCQHVCTQLLSCDDCSDTGDKTNLLREHSFQPFPGFAHPQLASLLQFSQPLKWAEKVTLYFDKNCKNQTAGLGTTYAEKPDAASEHVGLARV